jgi:hypothetical protein
MYSAPAVGSICLALDEVWAEIPPVLLKAGGAGFEPARPFGRYPCILHRQSSVFCDPDEGLHQRRTASCQLLYGATLLKNGAGGTRTRNLRVMDHVLQHGSRDFFVLRTIDEGVIREFRCSAIELRLQIKAEATGFEPATRGLQSMYSNRQSIVFVHRPANEDLVRTLRFLTGRCSPSLQLAGQRRRQELNLLQPVCSRSPGRLAPASFNLGFRIADCGLRIEISYSAIRN